MKKKIYLCLASAMVMALMFSGCSKEGNAGKDVTGSADVEQASIERAEEDSTEGLEIDEEIGEESKEVSEMANENFSDEEKKMMAGAKDPKNDDSEDLGRDVAENGTDELDENVLEINGFKIEVMPDMSKNAQKDGIKYGSLEHVIYPSKTCEKDRPMNVMLPADYDTNKKYPVLYVLHGIFGDEYSMCGDGKTGVPALIDNLMAEGAAKEMIVVYPYMFASKDKDQCTAIDDENVAPYDNFVNELVDDIMPYMSEHYSILEGKENTAITGFSMGGRESLAIGILRPDLFGYVGAISPAPGLVPGKDMHLDHKGQFEEEEITYKDEKPIFIMICAGTRDSVVGTFPKEYHELYEKNGIEHVWWEIPGSDHADPAISSGIGNFVKYIF